MRIRAQRHTAGTGIGNRRIDVDIAVRTQGKTIGAVPGNRVTQQNVTIAGTGTTGLNSNVAGIQLARERSTRDVAAARCDAVISWVNQPLTGLPSWRRRGDSCVRRNLYMGRRGFDKATITAVGCGCVQRARYLHGVIAGIAQQRNHAMLIRDSARLDDALVVHRAGKHSIPTLGRENHMTAIGLDKLLV